MSDETKYVEVQDKTEEHAVLLLEAAQQLKLEPDVVRTTSEGFIVPKEVADKAGLDYEDDEDEPRFKTKGEAEEYADEHGLDVDKSLKADEYKAAVAEAAQSKEN